MHTNKMDLTFIEIIDSLVIDTFKYRVSWTEGKISAIIKIGITFNFRLHRVPIELAVFVPVGLSSLLRYPTRSAEDVVNANKGLQERTKLIEWDDGETWK